MSQLPTEIFAGPRGFPQATHTLSNWQRIALIIGLAGIIACIVLWPFETLITINALAMLFYLITLLYKSLLIDLSLHSQSQIVISNETLKTPPPGGWPSYTVIVPMYKEGGILPHLVKGMQNLDYPTDKLQVRLLIEADDEETLNAAAKLSLPPHILVYPIPPSEPRTKPKACNVSLADTDSDYLVIYDAEDRPEPDQLKKAALAFSQATPDVACIQAKLNYYNSSRNFLTRCFTGEYATWFDLCLPGLDSLNALIPLGGTSNHFRVSVLKSLKGWDEYNVTEDCDLGLRIFYAGWRTCILDSTTWEQACPRVKYWISQRSRWVKGYVQTYLVHLRSPFKLCRRLGIANSLHFHLLIGGTWFAQLINPVYWLMTVFWIISQKTFLSSFFPPAIFIMAAICLFIGNFLFAYTHAIACVRKGFGPLAKYGVLLPAYWVLMSIGAWKGFLQLLWKPHYWEKTKHDFEDEIAEANAH